MVDVVETQTFADLVAALDAYKTTADARLAALEARPLIKTMPQDVKEKLIVVLEWLKVNV